MSEDIFYLVYEIANVLALVTAIYAVHVSVRFNNLIKSRLIAVYTLGNVLFILTSELNRFEFIKVNNTVAIIIFLLFHLFILSEFIKNEIKRELKKKYRSFFSSYFTYTTILLITLVDLIYKTYYLATVDNILLLLLSLNYFFCWFDNNDYKLFGKDGGAIFSFGVMVFSAINTPVLIFSKLLKQKIETNNFYYSIVIISPLSSILFYLITLKSLQCYKKMES